MKMFAASLLSLSLAVPAFAQTAKWEAGSYKIDLAHSKVGFEIPHLVISTVEGSFRSFEGTLDLKEKMDRSSVTMSVDVASIDTAVKDRDDHLRSADFFDAAKHPKMQFKSTSVKGTPEKFQLVGDLTIKGTKKRVTFDGSYLGTVQDAFGNQKVAFTATTKISRKEFGLTWNNLVEAGPVVGDQVTIKMNIQAAKPIKK